MSNKWDTKKQVEYFNKLSQSSRFKVLSDYLPGKVFYLRMIPGRLIKETIFIKFMADGKLLYLDYSKNNKNIEKLIWGINNDSIQIINVDNSILLPSQISCSNVLAKQINIISKEEEEKDRVIAFTFFNENQFKILLYFSQEENLKFIKYFE